MMLGYPRRAPDHASPGPQRESLLLTHIRNGEKWPFSTCIMMHGIFLLNSSKNFRHCNFSFKETSQTLMIYKTEAVSKLLPSKKDTSKSSTDPNGLPSALNLLKSGDYGQVSQCLCPGFLCEMNSTQWSRHSILLYWPAHHFSAHEQNVSEQP